MLNIFIKEKLPLIYMYYQLPNGKTIWLDVADVLRLTDQDVRDLIATNAGEHIHSPWHGSSIKNAKHNQDEEDEEDSTEEDSESYYEEYFPDEFPDVPDEDVNLDFEI
jgi:hypothetical protein